MDDPNLEFRGRLMLLVLRVEVNLAALGELEVFFLFLMRR